MLDHLSADHLAPTAGITARAGNGRSIPAGAPAVEVDLMPAQAPGALPDSTRTRASVVAVTVAALLLLAVLGVLAVLAVVLIGDAVLVGLLVALLLAASYGARHLARRHMYARVQHHRNRDRDERDR
jgi:hypothetical protein